MNKKSNLCALILLFAFNSSFYGQITSDTISVQLSDVEIVGQRNKLYSELGRVLTVIDKEEINRMPVHSIDEILDQISGLDIRQRGTFGVQADISVHGGSFDQVLVLLNGINITDPQTGHFNLDIPLNFNEIDRIEILQGSAARLLGPNAFSGAINIITNQNKKQNQLKAELSAGSNEYSTQNISTDFNIKNVTNFISFSHKSSDGYIENTDFDITNIFLHSSLKTATTGKLDFQIAGQQKGFGANEFYSLTYPHQYENTQTYFTSLSWNLNKGKLNYLAQIYWRKHHDRFELFRNYENAPSWYQNHNYHLTDIKGAKANVNYIDNWGKITLGIELRNEHIYSTVLGEPMEKTVVDPFEHNIDFTHEGKRFHSTFLMDYSKDFYRWYFSAGVAITYSSSFGQNTFGGFDIAYAFTDEMRIFFSANSAIRLPTFTDLYYQSATQISNPNLKPETSKNMELGIKSHQKNVQWNICTYYRAGNNIIDWIKHPDSTQWISTNLIHVNAFGADFYFAYRFQHFFLKNVSFSYSYLHQDKNAEQFDSKYALDYLKHKANLKLEHSFWKNLTGTWVISYFDRAGNYTDFQTQKAVNYKPYFLADFQVNWVKSQYEIYTNLNNLLNVRYEDYGGIVQPGFTFNVGFRWKFI